MLSSFFCNDFAISLSLSHAHARTHTPSLSPLFMHTHLSILKSSLFISICILNAALYVLVNARLCVHSNIQRARTFFLFSHYVCDKTKAESPEVLRPSLTYKIKSMTHRARRRKSQSGNNTSVYSSGPPRKKG